MGQFSNVLLVIVKANTVPQRALDCGPGLGGLNKAHMPNCRTPPFRVYVPSISTSLQIGISMISEC